MNKVIVRKSGLFVWLAMLVVILATCSAGGGATPTPTQPAAGLANPASVNCEEQGGTHSVETRDDGGEYGICLFEDNMQCEEFALLRGDCPVGGVRVTGFVFVTDAGRYCAITGGTYAATGGTNSDGEEAGSCTFSNGQTCDVFEYYNGTCNSEP